MKCMICESSDTYYYTTIDGVVIYACRRCLCGQVDPQTPRKKTEEIYSFPDYQMREQQFVQRYTKTVRLINDFSHGKRVLEVGAGFGLLSSMLCKAGYDVTSLEPDVNPEYLKTLPVKVFKEYLDEFAKHVKIRFDVIIMYDVLEHVDDPQETTLTLKSLLNPEGIIVIQTPNYRSLMAKIVHKWSWWMVEDHRFFFSKKSLRILFDKKKWNEVFFTTYEDWYDFKKNLDGTFKNKWAKRLFFMIFIPLYFFARPLLWSWGYGGLHLGILRKNTL